MSEQPVRRGRWYPSWLLAGTPGACGRFTPIIATAGLTAAAGTGALLVAGSPAFRAFGPGTALAILIDAFVVRSILVPSLLTLMGSLAEPPRGVPQEQSEDKPLPSTSLTPHHEW